MGYIWAFVVELVTLFIISQTLTRSLSFLFLRVTKSEQATIRLLSFIFLPGVIIHELSHAFSAGILFVRVGQMEFVPKVMGNRVKLGGVEIERTGPIRRALVGLAPLLFGGTILIVSLFYAIGVFALPVTLDPFWKWAIELYILFEIGNTMFSSRKDVEGSLAFFSTIVLLLILGYIVSNLNHSTLYMDGLNFLVKLVTPQIAATFQRIDTLLLIPLVLDGAIIGITKILSK